MAIVDAQFDKVPELRMDRFKQQPAPMYTEETIPKERRQSKFSGSAAHLKSDFFFLVNQSF